MNSQGCSIPVITVFSAVVAASFTYTGVLYDNNVLLGFGIFQIIVTLAGVYALISNNIKKNRTQQDASQEDSNEEKK